MQPVRRDALCRPLLNTPPWPRLPCSETPFDGDFDLSAPGGLEQSYTAVFVGRLVLGPNGTQTRSHDAELVFEETVEGLYGLSTAVALCCNLICLFISTTVSMTGPGMALRGPAGSVHIAVRHMEQMNKRALRFFGRGLVALCLSMFSTGLRYAAGLGVLKVSQEGPACAREHRHARPTRRETAPVYIPPGVNLPQPRPCYTPAPQAFFIGAASIWTLVIITRYGSDIAEKFYVSPRHAVSGAFVAEGDGKVRWVRRKELQGRIDCFGHWKPPGNGVFTSLWRLDKLIAFPYYDEQKVRCSSYPAGAAAGLRYSRAVGGDEHLPRPVGPAQSSPLPPPRPRVARAAHSSSVM